MEQLKANVVGLSVAIVTALVYLACLAFVAIFPIETGLFEAG